MARPRPDLPNSKKAARGYVEWLSGLGIADKIMLAGSRVKGRETEKSDWDFILVTSVSPLRISQPRDQKRLHGDLAVTKFENLHMFPNAVEVWPTDDGGYLK